MKKRVLVISSNDETVSAVKDALFPLGYEILNKRGLKSGVKAMQGDELVLLDMSDPFNALREIKSYHPEAVVLLLGGNDYVNAADEGAYDYLKRSCDACQLKVAVKNAMHYMSLREELQRHMRSETPSLTLGTNVKMSRVLRHVERLSSKDVPVMIMGERGTGKELVAKAIHLGSFRASGAFVTLDASKEDFLKRFFKAPSAHGALMTADGGTVFLKELREFEGEEIDRLSAFMSDGKVVPEVAEKPIKVDVRIICSVNGTGITPRLLRGFPAVLRLPSLRERPEDVLPLAEQFLLESAKLFVTGPKKLAKEAARALLKHSWPGNIGELKNTMRRACLLARDNKVEVRHLALEDGTPYYSVKEFLGGKLKKYLKNMTKLDNAGLHGTVMSEVEKSLIELVLEETGGNQLRAAAALGINRTTLRTKIRNYKIRKQRV
jgi:DNA-binding NtrC family response regulator